MSADVIEELTGQLKAEGLTLPASAAMLCEAYAAQVKRMRDARSRIDEEGEVIAGPRDQAIAHPSIATERAATTEVAKLHKALLDAAGYSRRRRPSAHDAKLREMERRN